MTCRKEAEVNQDVFRHRAKHPNKTLKLNLPLPPSVNSMYVGSGRTRRLSAKAQRYIAKARALINLAIDEQYWFKQARETWLYVDMVFFMPDRKVRDSHNMLKLLMDVMQDVVYENDYFALPRIQSVEYDKQNPRVEILISSQTKNAREKGLKMTHIRV